MTALTVIQSESCKGGEYEALRDSDRTILKDVVADVLLTGADGVSFFAAPLRFDAAAWETTALAAAAFGLGMSLDRSVQREVFTIPLTHSLEKKFSVGKEWGTIPVADAVAISLYATGLLVRSDDIRAMGRMVGQALVYSGTIVLCLQIGLGRNRPHSTEDPYDYRWMQTNNAYQAMPSGHTTVAFAVSTVLAEGIDTWWSRVLFYSLAAYTGISQVVLRQHWFSDVLAGAGIGFAAGTFVVDRERNRQSSFEQTHRLDLLPFPGGIHLAFHF